MQDPDTHLFIEIICDAGVSLLYSEELEGLTIEYYHGLNGRKVQIISSDEYISTNVAKRLLIQLGLEYLIEGLFPD